MKRLETGKEVTDGRICSFYKYVVVGDPIPLARHRHGNGHTWDPQKQLKKIFYNQIAYQHLEKPMFSGPIHIDFEFYFPIARTSKTARDGAHHVFRPDLSNLVKFVEDAVTLLLYKDDACIASFSAAKKYSTEPRTEFTISELKNYE